MVRTETTAREGGESGVTEIAAGPAMTVPKKVSQATGPKSRHVGGPLNNPANKSTPIKTSMFDGISKVGSASSFSSNKDLIFSETRRAGNRLTILSATTHS